MTKYCWMCGIAKGDTEFYRDRTRSDGLTNICRVCVKKRDATRYRDDRVSEIQRATDYKHRHPEVHRLHNQKWYAQHPEVKRAQRQRRRVRVVMSVGAYTETEWQALCFKYDGVCLCCKQRKPLTVDHIVPISRGGSNSISNLQPLCAECNSRKGQKIIDYRGCALARIEQLTLFDLPDCNAQNATLVIQ